MSSSGTNLERGCIRGQQDYRFSGKLGSKGNMVVGKKSRPAAREAHTSASKSHSTVVSRWWLLVVWNNPDARNKPSGNVTQRTRWSVHLVVRVFGVLLPLIALLCLTTPSVQQSKCYSPALLWCWYITALSCAAPLQQKAVSPSSSIVRLLHATKNSSRLVLGAKAGPHFARSNRKKRKQERSSHRQKRQNKRQTIAAGGLAIKFMICCLSQFFLLLSIWASTHIQNGFLGRFPSPTKHGLYFLQFACFPSFFFNFVADFSSGPHDHDGNKDILPRADFFFFLRPMLGTLSRVPV